MSTSFVGWKTDILIAAVQPIGMCWWWFPPKKWRPSTAMNFECLGKLLDSWVANFLGRPFPHRFLKFKFLLPHCLRIHLKMTLLIFNFFLSFSTLSFECVIPLCICEGCQVAVIWSNFINITANTFHKGIFQQEYTCFSYIFSQISPSEIHTCTYLKIFFQKTNT